MVGNNFTRSSSRRGDGGMILNQLQGIDGLSNIILSIEFDAIFAAFAQLVLNSTAQLSISAIHYCTKVTCTVFQHGECKHMGFETFGKNPATYH